MGGTVANPKEGMEAELFLEGQEHFSPGGRARHCRREANLAGRPFACPTESGAETLVSSRFSEGVQTQSGRLLWKCRCAGSDLHW